MSYNIRPSKPSDISAIADVSTSSNATDELTLYMTRDIEKYPTSFRNASMRYLKKDIQSIGAVCYVCETDVLPDNSPLPNDEKRVIGWAIWTRTGDSAAAKAWQAPSRTLSARFARALEEVEFKYADIVPINRTNHAEHKNQIMPILGSAFDRELFADVWELNQLNVHPDYQRRGIGQKLVQWGMDQAEKECVPVIVGASPTGLRLYEKLGFQRIARYNLEPFMESLRETKGCWTLVWEPKDSDERWWDRALEKVEGQAMKST